MTQFIEKLAAMIQHVLPQHFLSALIYRLMRIRVRWLKNAQIRGIGALAGIDFGEARSADPDHYECFNEFFTRELKPGARRQDPDPAALLCPCDGRVSEAGQLEGDRLLQAKGKFYSLEALLAGDPACARLAGGSFFTIYLSPRDYHRVHMPMTGHLQRMIHVPGKLFSVAPYTVREIPGLFARNERVVCMFDTDHGPMAQVLVGAMLVGSMATVWAGEVTPARHDRAQVSDYSTQVITLDRGAEMGRFNMGSTVILIVPPGALAPGEMPAAGSVVRLGQSLGVLNTAGATTGGMGSPTG